jgi:hypothetical protein
MAEAPFGMVSPIWSAVPFPGLAWFQTPMAGHHPLASPAGIAGVPGPFPGDPYAFNRGIAPAGSAPGFGAGSSNFASPPMNTAFPSFVGPDIAVGVTAPALVMAVAMRRGQPAGPTSDQEIEDFIYDALDLLSGASDVEVRSDGGRTTLAGAVSQKRLKRDIGEIAWAIPGTNDVQNNITIAPRRRSRPQGRDAESAAVVPGRKTA